MALPIGISTVIIFCFLSLSSKIKYSECGNWYGSKVWHSQDKYRRVIFQCNHKFKNDKKCWTPRLTEDEIKDAFVKAVNAVIPEKDELIANTKVMMRTVCDTTDHCPCGNYLDFSKCSCNQWQIQQYLTYISRPLLN